VSKHEPCPARPMLPHHDMLDPATPVANLVLDHSECAPVFARHRIDYCCKGKKPLADACRDLGLDIGAIVGELETAIAGRHTVPSPVDPRTLSTREVITTLIAPHHQYLHRSMPYLQILAAKVARVHGEHEPSLLEVALKFDLLVETLRVHLAEEEAVLFPALIEHRDVDVIEMLLDMRREHEEVGSMLAELRRAARDYVPPDWACNSYRTLMSELAALEADVLEHVHIENHVLLPRFVTA
jgi:regulator of cell morphogenesis and NO signaling